MTVYLHEGDIPSGIFAPGASIAVDTETMGLITPRDRLCVVQLSDGGADEHLVRFAADSDYAAPNLKALLADPERLKLYHFGRFDIAAVQHYLGVVAAPAYCTKIASRLVRTYTDRHGLKELVRELLGQDVSKQQPAAQRGAEGLCRVRRSLPAPDEGRARQAVDSRRPHGARAEMLRLPADPCRARSRRMARDRHLRARLT